MMANNGNGRMTGVGSGTTQRGTGLGGVGMLVDSNGPVSPAGSKTLNVVGTYSADVWSTVIASFKPYEYSWRGLRLPSKARCDLQNSPLGAVFVSWYTSAYMPEVCDGVLQSSD